MNIKFKNIIYLNHIFCNIINVFTVTFGQLHSSLINKNIYVTLDHKTSHKSNRDICSNSQQYIRIGQNDQVFFYDKKNH